MKFIIKDIDQSFVEQLLIDAGVEFEVNEKHIKHGFSRKIGKDNKVKKNATSYRYRIKNVKEGI